jgi:hypothetical protein
LARELIIHPRFKRDYRVARKHPEFDAETLEYVFDVMIAGGKLPDALRERRGCGARGGTTARMAVPHNNATLAQ